MSNIHKVKQKVYMQRKLAKSSKNKSTNGDESVAIIDVETTKEARARRGGARAKRGEGRHGRYATIGRIRSTYSNKDDPARAIGKAINDALDPVKAPSKVRTLADMTLEERAEMERLYSKVVKPL